MPHFSALADLDQLVVAEPQAALLERRGAARPFGVRVAPHDEHVALDSTGGGNAHIVDATVAAVTHAGVGDVLGGRAGPAVDQHVGELTGSAGGVSSS
jgi:hypothetical protein